jgi:RNA polymerase sigma-70 factor (ECF subfamily)
LKEEITEVSDEQLASLVAEEVSEEACTELFQRYKAKIYAWCFNYTHNEEDAVDLAQEIFVKIFRKISTFRKRSRFSTWVYSVTRNHCLEQLSKKRTIWRRRMLSTEENSLAEISERDTIGEIELTWHVERILQKACEYMKEDELEAFVLHYRDGFTIKEVTRILRCENVSGARTLIQNARRKFSGMIMEEGLG